MSQLEQVVDGKIVNIYDYYIFKVNTLTEFMDNFQEEYGLSDLVTRLPDDVIIGTLEIERTNKENVTTTVIRSYYIADFEIKMKALDGSYQNVDKKYMMVSVIETDAVMNTLREIVWSVVNDLNGFIVGYVLFVIAGTCLIIYALPRYLAYIMTDPIIQLHNSMKLIISHH